jgi:hypothetical protein
MTGNGASFRNGVFLKKEVTMEKTHYIYISVCDTCFVVTGLIQITRGSNTFFAAECLTFLQAEEGTVLNITVKNEGL